MMDEITELKAAAPRLAPRDREFADSLIRQSRRRALTDKQMVWVRKLCARAAAPTAPAPVAIAGLEGVVALLNTAAASGLKFPRLRVRAAARDLVLTIAGERSRHPGTINVAGPRQNEGERAPWYGRILRDGRFEPGRDVGANDRAAIDTALRALASEPARVAADYGRMTGNCCMCGIALTDPRSVHVGYGPICADNWGLPWGERPQQLDVVGTARTIVTAGFNH